MPPMRWAGNSNSLEGPIVIFFAIAHRDRLYRRRHLRAPARSAAFRRSRTRHAGAAQIAINPHGKTARLEPPMRYRHITGGRADVPRDHLGCRKGPAKSLNKGFETMSRVSSLSSPFLLGFDEIERVLDRVGKAAEGYPPYNIERVPRDGNSPERLRITLSGGGLYPRSARCQRRGEPARHSRSPAGRQKPAIHPPRHCRAPIPAYFRAGGRHGGVGGGFEERIAVD